MFYLFYSQELLFCETCDTVFCTLCTGGTHKPSPNSDPGIISQTSSSQDPTNKSNSPTILPLNNKTSLMSKNSTAVINTADHTVIPFSVAIKRMSEILIYKANECTAKVYINLEEYPFQHCDTLADWVNSFCN